jgi:hypothetical protein
MQGIDYPLWIAPALILFIAFLTGIPSSSNGQIILRKGTKDQLKSNKGYESKSQRSQLVSSFLYDPPAHINHPLSMSFDVKTPNVSLSSPPIVPPTILFQVYSVGWFDRHRLEGYGYLTLPQSNGKIDTEIRTWKPKGEFIPSL